MRHQEEHEWGDCQSAEPLAVTPQNPQRGEQLVDCSFGLDRPFPVTADVSNVVFVEGIRQILAGEVTEQLSADRLGDLFADERAAK